MPGVETMRPLDGTLVVELTRNLPGPYAGAELLRLGARVVRLEAPEGDPLRATAPSWHDALNAGKESVVCDLKLDRAFGQALCSRADVVLEGFRPGVAERLGVGPEDLPPGIVYCSIRGYADHDDWSPRAGHDLNYLGMAGVLDPEAPQLPPIPIADLAAGALTAVARILAGLLERGRTGRGSVQRVSMTDEARRLVGFRRGEQLSVARPLTGGLACYDVYRCADGTWLSVAALEPSFFVRLCELVERVELGALQYQPDAQDDLRAVLGDLFASRPRTDWLRLLAAHDTCVAPVLSLAEASRAEPDLAGAPTLGEHTEAWRKALELAA